MLARRTKLEAVGSSTLGLFAYEELGSDSYACITYSDAQLESFLDAPWKAARAFAILANICNGVTMLFLIAASCVSYNSHALKVFAGLSFSGSASQMLTFTMFASKISDAPYNGTFYVGGGMAIIAFLFSITTGLLILQIPPPGSIGNYTVSPPPPNQRSRPTRGAAPAAVAGGPTGRNFPAPKRSQGLPETAPDGAPEAFQPGTETVTETIMPDGSHKVVKTTVHTDGSQIVTETIVRKE